MRLVGWLGLALIFGVSCGGETGNSAESSVASGGTTGTVNSTGGFGASGGASQVGGAPAGAAGSTTGSLDSLNGGTFRLSAAGSATGAGCGPGDSNAVYSLTFSADGTEVTVVRIDSVQEPIMHGSLVGLVSGAAQYHLDNGWAGTELSVRVQGEQLQAHLAILGSGVPVKSCIEAQLVPTS